MQKKKKNKERIQNESAEHSPNKVIFISKRNHCPICNNGDIGGDAYEAVYGISRKGVKAGVLILEG